MVLPATPQPPLQSDKKINVMIIDDSAVIRGMVSRWLADVPDIELIGFGTNGQDGVNRIAKLDPDIVILDIEMPEMDGITALPLLLKEVPGVRIIMASTLTKSGAEVTIRALSAGATDYIAKPDAGRIAGADDYRQELLSKLRGLGKKVRRFAPRPIATAGVATPNRIEAKSSLFGAAGPVRLRPFNSRTRPSALFIGSSTGGPEALRTLVSGLAGKIHVPIFITQHMPPLFTKILAEHLSKQTGASVLEAHNDMIPHPGVFHIAPGGKHMVVSQGSRGVRIQLNENPPENFCRPAVDPLFRSAAQVYGDKALAVVLTGMGHDGREGSKLLSLRGANIIVQDENTSVVWGMPGSVATSGYATQIKPIDELPQSILNIFRGVAP